MATSETARRLRFGATLWIAGAAALATASCARPAADEAASDGQAPAAPRRPDIVLILADDLGFADIGAYGGEVPTPHLDRLAENGVRLLDFHSTAKCFPSRAALLTGQYPQQVGRDRRARTPMVGGVTIAETLGDAGYQTFMVGKHHGVTHPMDRGFDRYLGLRDGAANHFNPGVAARPGEPEPARKAAAGRWWCFDRDCGRGHDAPADFYSTDAFTDWAVELVDEASPEAPFFLYLAYTAPHDPLQAPAADVARFEGAYDAGYGPIAEARFARQKRLGLVDPEAPRPAPHYQSWDDLSADERADEVRRMEIYAAMIARLDAGVGRVVDALARRGSLDETLIVFASDNGASAERVFVDGAEIGAEHPVGSVGRWASLGRHWAEVGNTPYRKYKNDSYNGGTAGPFIAHWPAGLAASGDVRRALSHLIDLHPTLADAADVGATDELEGVSLLPTLRTGAEPARAGYVFNRWSGGRFVRGPRYKLVSEGPPWEAEKGAWELYDLQADPFETRDLAGEAPERVREMAAAYDAWLARVSN